MSFSIEELCPQTKIKQLDGRKKHAKIFRLVRTRVNTNGENNR